MLCADRFFFFCCLFCHSDRGVGRRAEESLVRCEKHVISRLNSRTLIQDDIEGMSTEKTYFVYILTNPSHTVLYIGVTNNLVRRVFEHKQKIISGFTQKYNCIELIYYEQTSQVISAIEREKQLKQWNRKKKENLIKILNPKWTDLSVDF